MKKIIALVVVIAVLAALAYAVFHSRAGNAGEKSAESRRQTAVAEKGDLSITVSATGRVEPEREVEIKSKASGEVIKVNADVSDEVKQGMLLFKLDPTDEERSVAKLRATLSMSKAKLEQTRLGVRAAEAKLAADTVRANADLKSAEAERNEYESRLKRAEQLFGQKVISREELDTAVTRGVQTRSALANARAKLDDLKVQALELDKTRQEIPIAEAQVENDNVALGDALQRLKETEVFAPIDGVVSERLVQEGIIVASGVSNVGGGTTAMKVIDLSRVYAIAAVDEADISGIVPGVKAVVTADAYKGMEFTGSVIRVAATGVVESNVVTFDVKVEVDSRRKSLLKPEMTTNVVFLVDDRKDVVLVPASAVVRKAVAAEEPKQGEGGGGRKMDYRRRQAYVTVVTPDGAEEERPVGAGITDGNMIEIVSGLAAGETVVLQEAEQSGWAGQQGGRRGGLRRM
ncbi:MAG: efflux RND transporter periplasmic adaptor subunit [Planctomycetota bacterium]|jgi:HlyD family secretion protein|nr:efflux RND transporter periplasmic adaptor subunit [Planctomycetota bacterium]